MIRGSVAAAGSRPALDGYRLGESVVPSFPVIGRRRRRKESGRETERDEVMMDIDAAIAGAPEEHREALGEEKRAYQRIHETAKAVLAEVGIHTRNPRRDLLPGTNRPGRLRRFRRPGLPAPRTDRDEPGVGGENLCRRRRPEHPRHRRHPALPVPGKGPLPHAGDLQRAGTPDRRHRGKPGRGALSQSAGQGAQRGPASMQPDHGSAEGLHQGHLQRLPAG